MSDVTSVMHAPGFDGDASSCANYEEKATLRNQISTLGPQGSAADLLLHMTDIARKVCMSVGMDGIGNVDGVAHFLRAFCVNGLLLTQLIVSTKTW